MIKIIKINLIILLSILSFNFANAAALNEDNCLQPAQVAAKIGNFTSADEGSSSTLKACSPFILKQDLILNSNLEQIGDLKTISKFEKYLTSLGNDFSNTIKSISEKEGLLDYANAVMLYVLPPLFTFFLLAFSLYTLTSRSFSNESFLKLLSVGVIGLALLNMKYIAVLASVLNVSFFRFNAYNNSDFETLNDSRDYDIYKLLPESSENSLSLAASLLLYETQNKIYENKMLEKYYGQNYTYIPLPFTKSIFDNKNPTIKEFNDFFNECKKTNFLESKKDINISFAKFNISRLTTTINMRSGGETENYNCEKLFGRSVNTVVLHNPISNIIKNFANNLDGKIGDDVGVIDSIEVSLFDKVSGTITDELEQIERLSSKAAPNLYDEITLSLFAIKESKKKNIDVYDTRYGEALFKMIDTNFANSFDFKQLESISTQENLVYQAIKLSQFNTTQIAGVSDVYDDIVEDKKVFGYDYLKPFIEKTVELNLRLNCAVMNGQDFDERLKFATAFNNVDQNTKLKNAGTYAFDPACFERFESGILKAEGAKDSIEDLKIEVANRVEAISFLFDIKLKTGFYNIFSKSEVNDQLVLDILNTFTADASGLVNSFTATESLKSKLVKATEAIKAAYEFEYLTNIDTTQPQTYFNYHRAGNEFNIGEADEELKLYDFSNFFNKPFKNLNDKITDSTDASKTYLGDLFYNECKLKNSLGICQTTLLADISKGFEDNKAMLFKLSAAKFAITGIKNIKASLSIKNKNKNDKNNDINLGNIAGKSPFAKIGSIAIDGILSLADMLITPIYYVSMLMTIAAGVVLLIPFAIDVYMSFSTTLQILIPFLLITFLYATTIAFNMITSPFYLSNEDKNKAALDKLLDFKKVHDLIIRSIIIIVMFHIAFILFFKMINSKAIGGSITAIFDSLNSDSILMSIVLNYAQLATKITCVLVLGYYLFVRLKELVIFMWTNKNIMGENSGNNAIANMMFGGAMNNLTHNVGRSNNFINAGVEKLGKKSTNSAMDFKDFVNSKRNDKKDSSTTFNIQESVKDMKDAKDEKINNVDSVKPNTKNPDFKFDGDITKMSKDELKDYQEKINETVDNSFKEKPDKPKD